jgi:hypothetical protein
VQPRNGDGLLYGWSLNETSDAAREALLPKLLAAGAAGIAVLIVEPIARGPVPWWPRWAEAFRAAGGRSDEWRFRGELPELVRRLDRAAGLDHRERTARTLALWSTG